MRGGERRGCQKVIRAVRNVRNAVGLNEGVKDEGVRKKLLSLKHHRATNKTSIDEHQAQDHRIDTQAYSTNQLNNGANTKPNTIHQSWRRLTDTHAHMRVIPGSKIFQLKNTDCEK